MSNNENNKDKKSALTLVNEQKETQLHHYLGEIMVFPLEIQDKIIEEISMLPLCTKGAVTDILNYYTNLENGESSSVKEKLPL
jgi:hypothetical protein